MFHKIKKMSTLELHTKIDLLPENEKKEVAEHVDSLLLKLGIKKKPVKIAFGIFEGKIRMKENFDDRIGEGFEEYM